MNTLPNLTKIPTSTLKMLLASALDSVRILGSTDESRAWVAHVGAELMRRG